MPKNSSVRVSLAESPEPSRKVINHNKVFASVGNRQQTIAIEGRPQVARDQTSASRNKAERDFLVSNKKSKNITLEKNVTASFFATSPQKHLRIRKLPSKGKS